MGLSAITDPVTPEPDLWTRIERGIANSEPARDRVLPFNRLWQNINFWRATSAVGLAASIVLAIATFLKPSNQTSEFTVVLQSPEDRQVGWIVQGKTNQVQVIPLAKTTVAPNQALQLWTKPNQAKVPTSLGLVPANRRVQIPAERLPGLEPGQLFEITLEPATGSPIGRPTGKILFIGRATVTQ